MTTSTVGALLSNAVSVLDGLMRKYEALGQKNPSGDPTIAEFAQLLRKRERHTIDALQAYLEHDDHRAVLDVHVRLGAGFPYDGDDLTLPERPTLDELIELGERTDMQLVHLAERIEVYAVSGQLVEGLDGLERLVGGRRRELAAALHELEQHRPSPKQRHD